MTASLRGDATTTAGEWRTAYVRLHLLRLRGDAGTARPAGPVILPKPTDNAGPQVKAAPRRRIDAAPLPAG